MQPQGDRNCGAKSLEQLENKYLRPPPEGRDFSSLFDYAWHNGVGNSINTNGDSVSWTSAQLEQAFMDVGKDVSLRSIENWQSGGRLPRPKNVHALARIFGGDDNSLTVQWREALFEAIKLAKNKGKPSKEVSEKDVVSEQPEHDGDIRLNSSKLAMSALASAAISAILLYAGLALTGNLEAHKHAVATDIKFCTSAQFDEYNSICLVNMTEFSSGTKMIYVSFRLNGAFDGQKFERTWFRNGERLLDRTSFNHEAWSGYTYLPDENGHDAGRYVLEVSIGDQASSGHFTVGNPD